MLSVLCDDDYDNDDSNGDGDGDGCFMGYCYRLKRDGSERVGFWGSNLCGFLVIIEHDMLGYFFYFIPIFFITTNWPTPISNIAS